MSKGLFIALYAYVVLCVGVITMDVVLAAVFGGIVIVSAVIWGPVTLAWLLWTLWQLKREGWWPKRKPEPLQTHSAIVTLLQLRGEHLLQQGDKR